LKEFGYFRSLFDKARDAAEQEAEDSIRHRRNARHQSGTKILGHTTEQMTAGYIRSRRGDVAKPLKRKNSN